MQLLLHDIRSPLGVAQGYIALLGGQALAADDSARALRGVTDAVARISRLVDDVGTLMETDETEYRHGVVAAALLCERVAAELARRGVPVAARDLCAGLMVRAGTSVDRLSEAIATVLSPTQIARGSSTAPMTLTVSRDDTQLLFRINHGSSASIGIDDLVAFDPKSISSIEHLRAHRDICLVQGHVLRESGESRACMVIFPLNS